MRPWLSAVVPVLDERDRLPGLVDHLVARLGVEQVVVADGGSRDGTRAWLGAQRDLVVVDAPRGRGPQLRAGAEAADGLVLWFVHADTRPPHDALDRIRDHLLEPDVVGGAFRTLTRLDRPSWIEPLLPLADLRAHYTGLPYGDQALFCRADAYRAAGGFGDEPLFEDLDLARRLRRHGRLVVDPAPVEVSARRYAAHPLRTSLVMNTFPLLHRLGVPARVLARGYRAVR